MAVGSSIQIALFAIPLAVIVAWIQDIPFSLNFDAYRSVARCQAAVTLNLQPALKPEFDSNPQLLPKSDQVERPGHM